MAPGSGPVRPELPVCSHSSFTDTTSRTRLSYWFSRTSSELELLLRPMIPLLGASGIMTLVCELGASSAAVLESSKVQYQRQQTDPRWTELTALIRLTLPWRRFCRNRTSEAHVEHLDWARCLCAVGSVLSDVGAASSSKSH